jgi:hypothetical protein
MDEAMEDERDVAQGRLCPVCSEVLRPEPLVDEPNITIAFHCAFHGIAYVVDPFA